MATSWKWRHPQCGVPGCFLQYRPIALLCSLLWWPAVPPGRPSAEGQVGSDLVPAKLVSTDTGPRKSTLGSRESCSGWSTRPADDPMTPTLSAGRNRKTSDVQRAAIRSLLVQLRHRRSSRTTRSSKPAGAVGLSDGQPEYQICRYMRLRNAADIAGQSRPVCLCHNARRLEPLQHARDLHRRPRACTTRRWNTGFVELRCDGPQ